VAHPVTVRLASLQNEALAEAGQLCLELQRTSLYEIAPSRRPARYDRR